MDSQTTDGSHSKRRVSIRTRALESHKMFKQNLTCKTDKEVVQTYVTEDEAEAFIMDAILKYYYKHKGSASSHSNFSSKFFNDNHFFHLHVEQNSLFHSVAVEILSKLEKVKISEIPNSGADEEIDDNKNVYSVEMIHNAVAAVGNKIGTAQTATKTITSFQHDTYSSIGTRNSMEDRISSICHANKLYGLKTSSNVSVFGVYDGHLGSGASEYARVHLTASLCKFLKESNTTEITAEVLADSLNKAFNHTDDLFRSFADDYVLVSGTTATLAVLVEHPNNQSNLMVAHVGDSLAVLSSNGKAVPLLVPHKPDRKEEKERIEKAGGTVRYFFGEARVNGVFNTSRSIGDPKYRDLIISTPEVTNYIDIEPGKDEFLVLASDGLFDVIPPQEVVDKIHSYLKAHGTIQGVAMELEKEAGEKKSKDNISITVILFNKQ